MNKFIKIKQEFSNWPKNCENEQERNRYIKEFLQREYVLLVEEIVFKGTEGLELSDKVGFNFCSKDFSRSERWMSFKPFKRRVYGVQSCPSIRDFNSLHEECHKCGGIIAIKNNVNLCLPRVLLETRASHEEN